MEIGKSGFFDLQGSPKSFAIRVNWSEQYDIVKNTSVVTIDAVQVKSSRWSKKVYYPDGIISVNGHPAITMDSRVGTHNVYISGLNTWLPIEQGGDVAAYGSVEVVHDNDGSKSVEIAVTGNRFGTCYFSLSDDGSTDAEEWYVTGSQIVTLTTIPRASTIGASDANIGANSTIIVTQRNTAYTHSISYEFGSLSGYITADGGISNNEEKYSATSISWKVPTAFYYEIPNAKTGICMLTIRTYFDTIQIGDAQTTTFTATASPELSAPSVSGVVIDSNSVTAALTGDVGRLVRYKSTALCTIAAEAKNGASIAAKKIAGIDVEGDTLTIPDVELAAVTFHVVDSRGYEATVSVSFDLIPYIHLTSNATGQRTDPTSGNAKISTKGDFFNQTFGRVDNSLTVAYRFREAEGEYSEYFTIPAETDENAYTAAANLSGLHYEHLYEFEIVVSDALESVIKSVIIKQGIPVFDWGREDFRINVALRLMGAAYGAELPEDGKNGQVFFLLTDNGYSVKIHNGENWI